MAVRDPQKTKQNLHSITEPEPSDVHRSGSFSNPDNTGRSERGLEKSASDTSLSELLAKAKHSPGKKERPDCPPSYKEALHRKALIQAGNLSEEEVERQAQNSRRAKELYEKSMRQYEQTANDSADSVSRDPPSYEEHQQRQHQRNGNKRSNSQPMKSTQSPKMSRRSKSNSPDVLQARLRQEQERDRMSEESSSSSCESSSDRSSPISSFHRSSPARVRSHTSEGLTRHHKQTASKTDSDLKQTSSSRENRKSPARHKSASPHRRRHRDREHSCSDPKLDRTFVSQLQNDHNVNRTNLFRSKSDSSEHLHKIEKFRDFITDDISVSEKENRKPVDVQKLLGWSIRRTESDSRPSHRVNSSGIRSVRNRDWHKELAEHYSKEKDRPMPEQRVHQPVVRGPLYVTKGQQQDSNGEGDKPRRRWQPPVHPTKDLIWKQENKPARPAASSQSNSSTSASNKTAPTNNTQRRHSLPNFKQNLAVADHRGLPQNQGVPQSRGIPAQCQEVVPPMPHFEPEREPEPEVAGISWSVAKLRNLYDKPKPQTSGAYV